MLRQGALKKVIPRLRRGWPAAFLFDLDGTLVDTEMTWAEAIVSSLADQGVETTLQHVAEVVFGHCINDIHAALHREFPQLPVRTPEEEAAFLRPYYRRLVADPAKQVIPSAVAFFRKVAAMAPCVIVSGSPHADVVAAAGTCGILPALDFVMGAEDYPRGKPAPDGFLKAAERLDVDASECVAVEDSSAGVAAGRAAGMHVLGIDRNPYVRQDFTGCDWIVHDLSEIDVAAVFGIE